MENLTNEELQDIHDEQWDLIWKYLEPYFIPEENPINKLIEADRELTKRETE